MFEALGDVGDTILEHAENAMSSPWIYALILGLAFLDAFFPVVPSETLVITAGVFAASGEPALLLVIVAASIGAFLGDHTSYAIGRTAGARVRNRFLGGKRASSAFTWASGALDRRGGLILVIARYIPGGRTAVTLTCGTLSYPLRKFSFFDMLAALSWGTYSGLIGYFGGRAFEDDPLRGLLLGLGIALGITAMVEIVRHVLRRRRGAVERLGEERDDGAAELYADRTEPTGAAAPLAEDSSESGSTSSG